MSASGISPQTAMAMVHAALAALMEVDPGMLEPVAAETLVIELACVGDRVGGELARFAAVVGASESWQESGAALDHSVSDT